MEHRLPLRRGLLFSLVASSLLALAGLAVVSPASAEPSPSINRPAEVTYAEARYEPASSGGVAENSASWNYRHSWGARNGEQVLALTNVPVSNGQTVLVTVTEGTADNVSIGGRIGLEFVGAAKISLNNVAVEDGAIRVWVTINWGSPLYLYIHYVIP